MILELLVNNLTRYDIAKIMTSNIYIYYKLPWNRDKDNYIVSKECRFNDDIIHIFSPENIIQKWTFKKYNCKL